MKRFEEVLEMLSYNELLLLKKDVDGNALTTKSILETKIKKKMKDFEKTCAICSNDLNFYSTSNYTLVFGRDDFKKKASFCGIDCLEYFILTLKGMKEKSAKSANEQPSSPSIKSDSGM